MVWLYHVLVTGEDGTPRLPSSGLTEEEKVVEEGKPVTLKWGDDGDDGGDGGDGDGSDGRKVAEEGNPVTGDYGEGDGDGHRMMAKDGKPVTIIWGEH